MILQENNLTHFIATSNFEAKYYSKHGERVLLWEMRTRFPWGREFFARMDGRDIRVRSLQEFMLSESDSISMVVPHHVNILWNGTREVAELSEIFAPMDGPLNPLMPKVWTNLRLTVGDMSYETTECDSFSEAIWELRELIGTKANWLLQTCCHCKFSYHAYHGPVNDRDDLRCFRDNPEAFAEIQKKGKFASIEALNSGDYFVNVFHSCAGWQRVETP